MKRHAIWIAMMSALIMVLLFPVIAAAAPAPEIVCIQCHGGLPGKYGAPVELWRGSIHAQNNIACNSCHGGDVKDAVNAMSPARGFLGVPKQTAVPAFCGRCHVGVMKDYLGSAHGKALGKGGPTCVTCHGNHLVVKASLNLINEKACTACHSFERAIQIKNAMQKTEEIILSIDRRINTYKQSGGDVDRIEKGLFALRNEFHTLFHELDVNRVKKQTVRIDGELKKLDDVLNRKDEEQQQRKIYGAAAVGMALMAALLLHLLKKSYDKNGS